MENQTQTNKQSVVEAKVFQLTTELLDTQAKQKAINSGYRDEVKRLRAEIKDLVEPKEKVEKK